MIADLIRPVQAALNVVAPSEVVHTLDAVASEAAPPRFVWLPTTIAFKDATNVGDSPRSLADAPWSWDVHCWAEDIDQAWDMCSALATALREVGSVDASVESAAWKAASWATDGVVLVVEVRIVVPLLEHVLDAPRTGVVVRTVRVQ